MDITLINSKIEIFMMVFARITGLFLIAPVFGSRMLPMQIKLGLSLVISLVIFNVVPTPNYTSPDSMLEMIVFLANELIVGLIIGFASQMVFSAIQFAGHFIDMQIGLSIVSVIDPQFGTQVPITGNFKYILALLVFLATNAHHLLISALARSYNYIPLMGFKLTNSLMDIFTGMMSGMMITAIKIALPVFGALFLVDLALGIISKTVPQMNVFIVGMPAKLVVGLIVLMMALPLYILLLNPLFDGSFADIFKLIRAMH
jgi:flagellar biosynthesis protein FliR